MAAHEMPSLNWSGVSDGHSATAVRLNERSPLLPLIGTTISISPEGAPVEPLLEILASTSSRVPGGAPANDSPDAIPTVAAALQGVEAGQMELGIPVVDTDEWPVTLRLKMAVPVETLLVKL